ncbi:MAG: tetratricopeptide repeat protein [Woeseiaceae bacterium]
MHYRSTICRFFRLVIVGTLLLLGSVSWAQEELNDNREIKKHKDATQTMTERVYKRLGNIHEMMGEERYQDALDDLDKLARVPLNDHEKALVEQTFGFLYVQTDRYQEALQRFEKSLSYDALPGAATQGMLYSVAGLYASEGKHLEAIATMRRWFQYEPEPKAEAYMVIASSFSELERYDDALPYVRKALSKAEQPKEDWYMLELAIHIEKDRYADAASVLRRMLLIWPEKSKYWELLTSIYVEMGEDKNALNAMMIAYRNGMITQSDKLLSLVQLNMLLEIPYTAGVIMETEMNKGTIEATRQNLDMLLVAWTDARAYDKAIPIIDQLAALTGDGSYHLRKAHIYNEQGNWEGITQSVDAALRLGVDEPAPAHMLAGMAYIELEKYADSERSFKAVQATGNAKQRDNAAEWLSFLNEKRSLRAALN